MERLEDTKEWDMVRLPGPDQDYSCNGMRSAPSNDKRYFLSCSRWLLKAMTADLVEATLC